MNVARRLLSILLVAVGMLVVCLGATLRWVDSNVLDTKTVTKTTREVLAEKGVQRLLAREIVDRVMSFIVDERYRPIVVKVVDDQLKSSKARELVVDGVRQSHQSLVDTREPAIVLNLTALATEVRAQVVTQAPPLDGVLPDPTRAFRFEIAQRSDLPPAWRWVDRFEGSGFALIVLGAAFAGLGFVLGPSRWALAIMAGALVLAAGLLTLRLSREALSEVRAKVTDPTAAAATNAILDKTLAPLDSQARTLAVTGGFAVLIGVGVRLIRPEYVRSRRDDW